MNILADRHHAGLYRSLQLLFEDRLGGSLYTPVGTEWRDAGFWRFGGEGPLGEALAQQYLFPHDGIWAPIEEIGDEPGGIGVFATTDAEFPDSGIWGVSLAAAKQIPWDYVVATVSDNQAGFKRFADQVGAKYVLQVGNTGQYIDWSLDPLVLNSSEMPIYGRGVYMHQEMDPAVSRFREPPRGSRIISSFVNCFRSMGRTYGYWTEIPRYGMGEYTFREYGIDGFDGVQKPIGMLANLMAQSRWGWHDKEHGDGFGHVLHSWAAIGRPLVGHGLNYAGKAGSIYWRHGETCVDLDVVDLDRAARMIREIDADEDRYRDMCRAIRATYDLIDYDAEEAAIRELLEVK